MKNTKFFIGSFRLDSILQRQSSILDCCLEIRINVANSYIKMDLQEVGGGHEDWMELAQDRDRWQALVGMVRDFWVP